MWLGHWVPPLIGIANLILGKCRKYAAWVKDNEPKTLTYAVLARPKGKKDSHHVIMFERYTGPDAIAEHGGKKEFRAML